MHPEAENVPTQEQVETQLCRMLKSNEFVSSVRLSDLLRDIVVNTLPDKEGKTDPVNLTEHQIGSRVFGETYDSDSSVVRTWGTFLRERIAKYYANSGSDDLVRIEVSPKGYRAVFSFNGKSRAGKLYRRACALVAGFVPGESEHGSLLLFREGIEADPLYAPAHAALAEAELREMMYRRTVPPHDPVAAAEASAHEAIRLQPRLWRAHIALAAVHCCHRRWDEAERSLKAVLALAPNAKRDHPWYAAFLLATGGELESREALRLARARAEVNDGDVSAQLALGLFLYVAREFTEAGELLAGLVERFPECWPAYVLQVCVDLAKGDIASASGNLIRVYEILSGDNVEATVFPGLYAMCALLAPGGGDERTREAIRQKCREDWRAAHRGTEEAMAEDFRAGFERAAEALMSNVWDPRYAGAETVVVSNDVLPMPEQGDYDRAIPYWTPFQVALAYIALGDAQEAIEALTRAVNSGDRWTVWLRVLPLLDPLRGEPGFQALVERMNFPSNSRK